MAYLSGKENFNEYSDTNSNDIPESILKIYFRDITYREFLFHYIILFIGILFSYNIDTFVFKFLLVLYLFTIPVLYFDYFKDGLKKYIPPPIKCYTMFKSNNYLLCRYLIIKHLNENINLKYVFKKVDHKNILYLLDMIQVFKVKE